MSSQRSAPSTPHGRKLTAKQVRKFKSMTDRIGYGPLPVGKCRKVTHNGVEICRFGRADYRLTKTAERGGRGRKASTSGVW